MLIDIRVSGITLLTVDPGQTTHHKACKAAWAAHPEPDEAPEGLRFYYAGTADEVPMGLNVFLPDTEQDLYESNVAFAAQLSEAADCPVAVDHTTGLFFLLRA